MTRSFLSLFCTGLLVAASAGASAQVISEFEPNPPGGDPADVSIEFSGTPGASFTGCLFSIENDGASGTVDRAAAVSGTFDGTTGLLVVSVPDLENPSFTVVLSDATGAACDTGGDIDTNDDGTPDNSAILGTIFDAIGSADSNADAAVSYADDLGGTAMAFSGEEPQLVFRSGSTGDLYAVNVLDPVNGGADVFDSAGNTVSASAFSTDPTTGTTFGVVNPERNPTVSQTVFDGAGWRLLSAPVSGLAVDDLADINLVQGIAAGASNGAQYETAGANLFTEYTGGNSSGSYNAPTDTDEILTPGRGFWWYWYDQDAGPFAGGTSQGFELSSFVLSASGPVETADVTEAFTENADEFYMTGNPFAEFLGLFVGSITTSAGTVQTTLYLYDPEISTYVTRTLATSSAQEFPDALAPWQGTFIQIASTGGANPTVTYDESSTRSGCTATAPDCEFTGRVRAEAGFALRLDGTLASGTAVADRAANLRLLDDAEIGWDRHDLSELAPPNAEAAQLALVGERDGEAERQGILSLPTSLDGARTIPVAFTATGDGAFVISWDAAVLPGGWTATLRDTETGTEADLAVEGTLAFDADASDWTDRFEILLAASSVANEGGVDAETFVGDVYPNPAVGAARLGVRLGAAQRVTATVFDAIGRQVAVAYDGDLGAGAQSLDLDTEAFSPGVYIVRVAGETFTESRRLVVTR